MLIENAEIFEAGTWPGQGARGVVFTEADLDGIVSAFGTLHLAGRVPLKLGHTGADARTSDSAPALGWVEAIRRQGGKLLANIKLTSDKLAEGIRNGSYKFVSCELLRGVEAGSWRIPWVLDAVALLGATPPAVGTLKSLADSMQAFRSNRPALQFAERLSFSANGHADPTAEVERLQAELRAMQFKAVTDMAIATGKCLPADVARFSAIVSPEGRTVEAWQKYSRGITPPKLGPAHRSWSGDSQDDVVGGDGSAGEQLNRLTAAYCEDQLLRFGREIQPIDAALVIQRKHRELTRQWHEDMNS